MAGKSTIGQAIVFITGDLKGLNKSLGDAKKLVRQNMGEIVSTIKSIGIGMSAAGASIAGGLTIAIKKVEEVGSQIHDMAQRVNASTESMSAFKFVAEQNGTTLEAMANAYKFLAKAITKTGEAEDETDEKIGKKRETLTDKLSDLNERLMESERDLRLEQTERGGKDSSSRLRHQYDIEDRQKAIAKLRREIGDTKGELNDLDYGKANAFDRLGLSQGALIGKTPDQQMLITLLALQKVQDKTEQVALAVKLFGKNGTELLPMLAKDAGTLAEQFARTKELGLIWTQAETNAADRMGDSIGELRGSLFGVMKSAIVPLLPMISNFVQRIVQIVINVRRWAEANQSLVQKVIMIAGGVAALLVALGTVGIVLPAIISGFTALTAIFGALFSWTGLIIAGLAALAAAWSENWGNIQEYTKAVWQSLVDIVGLGAQGIATFIQALLALIQGDWKGAWQIMGDYFEQLWDKLLARLKISLEFVKLEFFKFSKWVNGILGRDTSSIDASIARSQQTLNQLQAGFVSGNMTAAPSFGNIGDKFKEIGNKIKSGWDSIKTAMTGGGASTGAASGSGGGSPADLLIDLAHMNRTVRRGGNGGLDRRQRRWAEIADMNFGPDRLSTRRASIDQMQRKAAQDASIAKHNWKEDPAAKAISAGFERYAKKLSPQGAMLILGQAAEFHDGSY